MKYKRIGFGLAIAASGAFVAGITSPAVADTASDIAALKARLRQLEAAVAKQNREAKDAKAQAAHATNVANAAVAAKSAPAAPPPVFVSFKNGLYVETADKAYSFKVGGRILVDGGGISQPLNGYSGQAGFRQARLEVEGKAASIWFYKLQYDFAATTYGLFGDNVLSPGAAGTSTYGYVTSSNYVQQGFRDAYLGLQHPALTAPFLKDPLFFMIGSQYEPFSLEAINSSKYRDMIERPMAVEAFSPFRHIGASVGAVGENWTAKGGVYTTSFEDENLNPARGVPALWGVPQIGGKSWWQATGGGQYFDITGRVTWAPYRDEHNLLHVGVSGRYHQPNNATGLSDDRMLAPGNRIASEANVLGQKLLGTPDLSCGSISAPYQYTVSGVKLGNSSGAGGCVKDVETLGFEAAASHGPFFVQAEYIGTWYNRDSAKLAQATALQLPEGNILNPTNAGYFNPGGKSAYFDGYYVMGEYWLTGEEKTSAYDIRDRNGATFNQIKIKNPLSAGGWGAWGLAARFSSINMNNGPYRGSTLYNLLYLTTLANNTAARNYVANAGINGGRQQNVTVGLNWYPDVGIAFQANWTRVMDIAAPLNGYTGNTYYSGAHPNLFELRAKVYW